MPALIVEIDGPIWPARRTVAPQPTNAEVTVDVGVSYDSNGVVQVHAVQRDIGHFQDGDPGQGSVEFNVSFRQACLNPSG